MNEEEGSTMFSGERFTLDTKVGEKLRIVPQTDHGPATSPEIPERIKAKR